MQTDDAASTSADADPVSQFFTGLAESGHVATFDRESTTLRFDIADGDNVERWYVSVHDGRVAVSRQDRPAGAVVRGEGARLSAMGAWRTHSAGAPPPRLLASRVTDRSVL